MNQKIVKIFGKKAVIVKSDRKPYFVKVPIYDKSNLTKSGTYSIIGSRKVFVPAPSFVLEGYALQGFLKSKSETIAQFNQRHEKQNV